MCIVFTVPTIRICLDQGRPKGRCRQAPRASVDIDDQAHRKPGGRWARSRLFATLGCPLSGAGGSRAPSCAVRGWKAWAPTSPPSLPRRAPASPGVPGRVAYRLRLAPFPTNNHQANWCRKSAHDLLVGCAEGRGPADGRRAIPSQAATPENVKTMPSARLSAKQSSSSCPSSWSMKKQIVRSGIRCRCFC